jgi:hypothetical protein
MHIKPNHMQVETNENGNFNNKFDRLLISMKIFILNKFTEALHGSQSVLQGLILNWSGFVSFRTLLVLCMYTWNVNPYLNYPKFACLNKGFTLLIFIFYYNIVGNHTSNHDLMNYIHMP